MSLVLLTSYKDTPHANIDQNLPPRNVSNSPKNEIYYLLVILSGMI